MLSKKCLAAAVLSTLLPLCAMAADPVASATFAGKMDAETELATSAGTLVTGAQGWRVRRQDTLTFFEAPEEGNRIILFDTAASDGNAAISAAWARVGGRNAGRTPSSVAPTTARRGWQEHVIANYLIPDEEKAVVRAEAFRSGSGWTVMLLEGTPAVIGKRTAAVRLMSGSLAPKGYQPENFAGKKPNPLDAARIAQFRDFLTQAMKDAGVPGVGFALLDGGKIVHTGGIGVRELGKPALVDENTLFMAASNTKGMTTLLLAKLADQGKLRWDQPVTELYPTFKLGDAAVTSQVQVKHLVCACTGLPRRDLEGIYEFKNRTALTSIQELGRNTPTSGFGELYQYNNLIVSVAGFVAGSLAYPDMELGKAYDKAMQHHIFTPLGMRNTTFDTARVMRSNYASPHATDPSHQIKAISKAMNLYVIPRRPSGGVWTSAADFARYVQMEANAGMLPGGKQLVSRQNVLIRRAPQIAMGKNATYGMGLQQGQFAGVNVIEHGGSLFGYKSNFYLLPESGTGAVILTNSDEGQLLVRAALRRLMELVYDARPEAADDVRHAVALSKTAHASFAKLNTSPADPAIAAKLAARYNNPLLGDLWIRRKGDEVIMDVGEWQSTLASRKNPSGSTSMVSVSPGGLMGTELTIGSVSGKRTLVINSGQQEYQFTEIE